MISRRRYLYYSLLTCLSGLAAGCKSQRVHQLISSPQPDMLFQDITHESGISFKLGEKNISRVNALQAIGHGCGFVDYDNDGWLDILLIADEGALLYHNLRNGKFEDVTAKVLPTPPPNAHFLGCSIADYNNDGFPDILLTGYGTMALYQNDRNGAFKDVTDESGLQARHSDDWATSSTWADIDGDGLLELFVGRYVVMNSQTKEFCSFSGLDGSSVWMACGPDQYKSQFGSLYKNNGHGHFIDITEESGLGDAHGNNLGCMFCDYNNDGKPDLYLSNDRRPADLYLNLGNGKFRNVAIPSGVAFGADGALQSGMGIYWGDYDNDGRFDLVVANFGEQPKSLFHNDGGGAFTDLTYESGVGSATLLPLAFGACFVDAENRGLLDLVMSNGHVDSLIKLVDSRQTYRQSSIYLRNTGTGHFVDKSVDAGPAFMKRIVGRGVAIGDFNNDGKQDLLIVNEEGSPLLLQNMSLSNNHWITLRLLWGPNNTDAIGAKVEISTSSGKRIAEVRSAGTYLSADAPQVHFGLGNVSIVDEINIRWPDGKRTSYSHVSSNHSYQITPDIKKPRLLF